MKQYLAIDIGGTAVKLGIVDETGAVGSKAEESVNFDGYQTPVLTTVLKAAKAFVETQNIDVKALEGVGVSATGQIDSRKGIVAGTCGNFPNYINSPIQAELERLFGLPVTVANDANCMTLGEVWVGGAKGYTDVIGVTLGTGVGSGIILDGKIVNGVNCAGGECGHMVIMVDGEQCSCGRKGCWEAYASATALIRQTKRAMDDYPDSIMHRLAEEEGGVNGKTAFDAMRLGDIAGIEVVNNYIKYVSCGLINLVNALQPEIICIGGGVSKEGDTLLAPVQAVVDQEDYAREGMRRTKIVTAKLRNDAGIIGAAGLATQHQ